ncbi:MAG: BMC domain-containing protein [Clostridia bacterium]|nr:BMC domain-containing protein [Clostridia bacterium]
MSKALAMVEYLTVSTGITAADSMVKTANVELIEAHVVCPGKYIALIQGELSAVTAAVDNAKTMYGSKLVDSFVLGNPDESIFPAIYGSTDVKNPSALGVFETYSAASIIVAADIASKTADVELVELRIAKGMCGKSYMLITGEVSAVQASIDTVKERLKESSMYLDSSVIANPDKETWHNIM